MKVTLVTSTCNELNISPYKIGTSPLNTLDTEMIKSPNMQPESGDGPKEGKELFSISFWLTVVFLLHT